MEIMVKFSNQAPRQEPKFDGDHGAARLGELARQLDVDYPAPPTSPVDYAQPAHRNERPQLSDIQQIKSFAELPAKEIDEIIAGAKAEFEALEKKAMALKEGYNNQAQRLLDDFNKLRSGMKLSDEAFDNLRTQVLKLDVVDENAG
jgi:hypothetical protein